jgi:hypothetical protein
MRVKPEQASKVTMRMPTHLPEGEGCMSGEAKDPDFWHASEDGEVKVIGE